MSISVVSTTNIMRALVILLFGLTAVSAAPKYIERIVGGTVTTIQTYPEMASLLFMNRQSCGGTILTHSSILTAAHCVHRDPPARWRSRLGSTNANSGGVIINSARFITHPNYNRITLDSDISIIRLASTISFNNNIRAGRVIASNVNVPDGAVVWAVGWGDTRQGGSPSEQLRHVQIWTINHNVCRQRYASALRVITDNMLCSGWLDVGGRDQCQGDSGGPLFHNRAIAGVSSFGLGCGSPRFPGVNVRVQRFSNWIRQNQ